MSERHDRTTTRANANVDDQFNGPDEGGKMGENTPYAGGWDRQPSEEGIRIDAAIQDPVATEAGPNSDADTLQDDPQASCDNQAK